jgi:hypothetical protein
MNNYKNREIDLNQDVLIYRCLNRKGKTYSIKQNGIVVAHTTDKSHLLTNCKFIINKSGKKRCLSKKQRNVHAYIKGKILPYNSEGCLSENEITYNPYLNDTFMCDENEITECKTILISPNGIYRYDN